MDLTYDELSRLGKIYDDYKDIRAYIQKPRMTNYVQFDYAVVHEISLFMLKPEFDFAALERRIAEILSVLPAVKRIFAQPLIHLKEQDIILPAESVRIVNNNTLTHIASHSELWTDVKDNEIKPEKLLSRTYEDNYGIYENLVFCNVVDDILAFVRANIGFLKELIYTNQTIEINLLERVNHLNYFLALGKLHIGYSRNFEAYYSVAVRCLNKLQFIANSLIPWLKRPIYKNNRSRPKNLKIHKTNILSMHKEYHRIYKLAKSFARHGVNSVRDFSEKDVDELADSYFFFCRALLIFAVGHFDFTCNDKKLFDISKTTLDFKFKAWELKTEVVPLANTRLITVEINKDKTYKIVLIPSLAKDNDKLKAAVTADILADEYIVCTPYEEHGEGETLIDITSIESFRRLQQIILRGMIYADEARKDCPFCKNSLALNPEKSAIDGSPVYECISCRTEIHEKICEKTDRKYYYTKIAGLKPPQEENEDPWLTKRKAESKMYFRNITDITDDLEPIFYNP